LTKKNTRSAKDTNKHRVSGCIKHVSGITFYLKNNDLTFTFLIRVSRRIGFISLFTNNNLTATLPIQVSGRISINIEYVSDTIGHTFFEYRDYNNHRYFFNLPK
jgi:hypothetical protein